jgi:capsular polysaccharide export protein
MHDAARSVVMPDSTASDEMSRPDQGAGGRVFLFLQGPNCAFFTGIADELESRGHRCRRVNLCFGDWLFWRRKGAINYRGSFQKWEAFLAAFMEREGVTDLILNGEKRNYHKVAVALAKARGIEVTVTDFGYLRPDWITLEKNGMSGDSLFPKCRDEIARLASGVAEMPVEQKFHEVTSIKVIAESAGALATATFRMLYPGYHPCHMDNPLLFGAGYLWRLLKNRIFRRKRELLVSSILRDGQVFYLYAMQMEMDFQIRAYSSYPNQQAAFWEVISSFARNAPADSLLVMKIHPLDPGLVNWRKQIRAFAEEAGVAQRVCFLDGGVLEKLIRNCQGVITINSTVGLNALRMGNRVKALGQAVYNLEGLTFQGELDVFWGSRDGVDARFCDDFVKALSATTQIRGVYFGKEGLRHAINEAAMRLHLECVNKLMPASQSESVL